MVGFNDKRLSNGLSWFRKFMVLKLHLNRKMTLGQCCQDYLSNTLNLSIHWYTNALDLKVSRARKFPHSYHNHNP
jgi:hypothetical protein